MEKDMTFRKDIWPSGEQMGEKRHNSSLEKSPDGVAGRETGKHVKMSLETNTSPSTVI